MVSTLCAHGFPAVVALDSHKYDEINPITRCYIGHDSSILVQVHRAGSVNGLTMKTIAKLNFLPRYVHRFIHSIFCAEKERFLSKYPLVI